ncbi:Zinc-binding ribosomal protein [Phytophthora cactorum]|nr:Zinc-binding ribosomal protein [Phytophthora cactorum]
MQRAVAFLQHKMFPTPQTPALILAPLAVNGASSALPSNPLSDAIWLAAPKSKVTPSRKKIRNNDLSKRLKNIVHFQDCPMCGEKKLRHLEFSLDTYEVMDDVSIGLEIENASFLGASMPATQGAPPKPVPVPVPVPASTPAPLIPSPTPFATAPVLPVAPVASAVEENLRVSYHCKAIKCFRLQWESEIWYTRGGVMCKVHFVPEDLPSSVRGMTSNDVDADVNGEAHRSFCDSLFLLQRYVFQQLLGIQPAHLFGKVFPDPAHATGDASEVCGDYHLVPRFIAVNEEPLLHVEDLHSPNRVGYAIGRLLSVQKILEYLDNSARFTVRDFLLQFDHRELVDCIVSTRINGQPSAFRVDELVMEPRETEDGKPTPAEKVGIVTKDGRHRVQAIAHRSEGARNYDGAKSKKKIRKWQEQGEFLQLSPEVEPLSQELRPAECHLTGIRTDLFEVGSAMPMVLKYVRHFSLLNSFAATMGLTFTDKTLLRQAFTHGSYIDVGMQNVNTVEATRSRVRLGHVFENVASLKRSRSMLLEGDTRIPGKAAGNNASQLRQVAEKHLSGDFKEEFHSRYLCPYERLEFLGDAVLGFLVASSAFLKLPEADEGFLHQTRVDIVNNENLGKMAKTANLESLLLTAFDLAKLKEEIKAKITADCFEALLGALYKDQGIVPCRALLGKLMDMHDPNCASCAISPSMNSLLRRISFTHASFQKPQIGDDEFIGHDPSYERIEFLGDAVLQLLSSEFLVDAFPYHQEHLLTQVRSSLQKFAQSSSTCYFLDSRRPFDAASDESTQGVYALHGAVEPLEHAADSVSVQEYQDPGTTTQTSVLVPKDIDDGTKSKKKKANAPPGHAVALYVNNCQVARAVGRTIAAAQDAACMKALTLYGVRLHDD